MRRLALSVLPLVLGSVVAGAVAAPAQASTASAVVQAAPVKKVPGAEKKARWFVVSGTLTAATATSVTLTVKGPRRERGSTVTVPVADTARVTLNHTAAALDELPVGARVVVAGTVADQTRTATRVKAETRETED